MSVDYRIEKDGVTAELAEPLQGEGGTYALGGWNTAELNVTYNYSALLEAALNAAGYPFDGMVAWLDGRPVLDTLAEIEAVTKELPDAPDADDYWRASAGNVGHAAAILLRMGREIPDGTWRASG